MADARRIEPHNQARIPSDDPQTEPSGAGYGVEAVRDSLSSPDQGWFARLIEAVSVRVRIKAVQPPTGASPVRRTSSCQPADDLPAAARPQCVVRVLPEHQMMRASTRVDVRQLLRRRIVHGAVVPIAALGTGERSCHPALKRFRIAGRRMVSVIHGPARRTSDCARSPCSSSVRCRPSTRSARRDSACGDRRVRSRTVSGTRESCCASDRAHGGDSRRSARRTVDQSVR